MAVAVAQRNTGSTSTTAATSYSITLPNTSANTGDLYLVFVTTPTAPTLSTTSTGWAKLGQWSNTVSVAAFVGEEGQVGSLAVTASASNRAAWAALRLTGAWPGALSVAAATGSSTSHTPPSLSPSTGGVQYQWIVVDAVNEPTDYTPTGAPSGWSNYQSTNTFGADSPSDAFIATAELNQIASSETPSSFTGVTSGFSTTWVALTVAIPGPVKTHPDIRLNSSVARATLY